MNETKLHYGHTEPKTALEGLKRNERIVYYCGYLASDRSVTPGAGTIGEAAYRKYQKGDILLFQRKVSYEKKSDKDEKVTVRHCYEYIAVGV